ncbi:hypothetical protein [Chitinimonas sp.]|uniref:hypothetical protein n=1 Tax=Chitinimonas sp. TaxID=1934313 RepID=UPI002F947418
MRRYRLLLSIELSHEYYEAGRPRGLQLMPSDETAAFLDRHGVIVKPLGDRLALVIEEGALAGLWQERLQGTHPRQLRFRLRAALPELLLCTDTAALPQRLAPDGASAGSLVPVASLAAVVSLRRDPGLLVEIDLPLVTADIADPAQWAQVPERTYRVSLPARRTVWKYLLLGDWPAPAIRLVDLQGEVQFGEPEQELLPDGAAAWAIRSLSAIRLQEQGRQRFQLRTGSELAERVLVQRLPVAAPSGLRYESVRDVPTAVSEIFINR